MLNIFKKKEKREKGEKSAKLHSMLSEMLAESGAELLDEETIEAGRKAMAKSLSHEGIEYSADALKGMAAGMKMMLSCGGDNQLQIPMLMVISHLAKVEEGIEKVNKTV